MRVLFLSMFTLALAACASEATLAYWADDAVTMAPGQSPLRGRQAIRKFIEASAAIQAKRRRLLRVCDC